MITEKNVVVVDRTSKAVGTKCRTFSVHLGDERGKHIGNISKFKPRKGYQFPWQAQGPVPRTPATPNELLGSFFEKDGRKRALDAVIDRYNRSIS